MLRSWGHRLYEFVFRLKKIKGKTECSRRARDIRHVKRKLAAGARECSKIDVSRAHAARGWGKAVEREGRVLIRPRFQARGTDPALQAAP